MPDDVDGMEHTSGAADAVFGDFLYEHVAAGWRHPR